MAYSSHLSLFLLLIIQLRHTAISGLVATFHPENCPSGTEANLYYSVCVHCRIGYFRQQGQQSRCERCPEGFITLEEGAGLPTDCDVPIGLRDTCASGYEWSSETERCELCPVNTYRSQLWDYWCMPCPENTNTTEAGAFSITQCIITGGCPPGTSWDTVTGWCEPCPIGWYRGHENGADCLPCAPGLTTLFPAASAFTECQPIDTRIFTNAECPSGTEYMESFLTCRVCERNTYRRVGVHDYCVPCPGGNQTLYEGAVDVSLCISEQDIMHIIAGLAIETVPVCPLGTEWHSLSSPGCYPCPRGTYRNQSTMMACQNCPDDVSTPTGGTIDGLTCGTHIEVIENVFQPSECLAGMSWDDSLLACMPCQYGSYSPEGQECLACPPGKTTAFSGATTQDACVLPQPEDVTTPFFETGQCPAGSEWDSSLVGCVPCPRGYYRSTEMTCQPCPEGLTTLSQGAKAPSLCFVPREGPSILPSSSDGCPRGYHNESDLWCSPCPRGTYKEAEGWDACQPCPSIDGGASPGNTRYYGAVSFEECLPDAHITRFSPLHGPQSGGTLMFIHLEASVDFRVLSITVAGYDCRPMSQFVFSGRIECITSAGRAAPHSGAVVMEMAGGEPITSDSHYTYLADPVVQELDRIEGIYSGGTNVLVKGENLNSVSTPNMILYSKQMTSYEDSIPIEWPCLVESSNNMRCMLGNLNDDDIRRKRRSIDDADDVTEYYLGFILDGVPTYSNLSTTMPEYGIFSVYPDPEVYPLEVDPRILTEEELTIVIQGSGLSSGVMTKDIRVDVGTSCQAEVVDLTPDTIIVDICPNLPRDSHHPIEVQIGSLTFPIGNIQMQPVEQASSSSSTDLAMPILVAITAFVLIIVLVIFLCHRWKRGKPATSKVEVDATSVHSSVHCTSDSAHLPPLPIDSVFGPDRVTDPKKTMISTIRNRKSDNVETCDTDRGVGMRALAFPGDGGVSYTTVEPMKRSKRKGKSAGSVTPILQTPQNAAKRRSSSSQSSSSQGFSSQPSTISSGSQQLPNTPIDVTT